MSDSSLAEKGHKLFTFLAKSQASRNQTVSTLSAYSREGKVIHLADLPVEPEISWGSDRIPEGLPFLTIERPRPLEKLQIPKVLGPSLEEGADNPDKRPGLDTDRLAEQNTSEAEIEVLEAALEQWLPDWDEWAEQRRRDLRLRKTYQTLYETYQSATQQSESFELRLGVGLLTWSVPTSKTVSRHLFTLAIEPKLDEATGRLEFHRSESAEGLKAEMDMLGQSEITDQKLQTDITEWASEFDDDPLDPIRLESLAKRAAMRLHEFGEWSPMEQMPASRSTPTVSWTPTIVLRPRRNLGIVHALQTIAEKILKSESVPEGLRSLLDPDLPPSAGSVRKPGALIDVDGEIFSPLPLNDVQRKILARVDSHAQTLVQGPPGTGKTHTAAALLSHLLAQGQRVLVTAHTERALHEIRDKLPDAIRPLAVSAIGSSRDDLADLRTAIDTISRQATEHDTTTSEKKVKKLISQTEDLKSERRKCLMRLSDLRENDVISHEIGRYVGTLSEISRALASERERFDWIEEFLPTNPGSVKPIDNQTALSWLGILNDDEVRELEEDSRKALVSTNSLPHPTTFKAMVEAEAAARSEFNDLGDVDDANLQALERMSIADRDVLADRLQHFASEVQLLQTTAAPWVRTAYEESVSGNFGLWAGTASTLKEHVGHLRSLLAQIPLGTQVDAQGPRDELERMATLLKAHISAKGPLKTTADGFPKLGFRTPKVVKDNEAFFSRVKINGLSAVTNGHLEIFLAFCQSKRIANQIRGLWPIDIGAPDLESAGQVADWHESRIRDLDSILYLADQIRKEESAQRSIGIRPPDWRDLGAIERLRIAGQKTSAAERLSHATQPIEQLAKFLENTIEPGNSTAASAKLASAVSTRDLAEFDVAYSRTQRLEAVRSKITQRIGLESRIRVFSEDLGEAVSATPTDPVWNERLTDIESAFVWAVSCAQLREHGGNSPESIQARITEIDKSLRGLAEKIASLRAWDHAVSSDRLTAKSKADLRSYSQQVASLGKGTGKHAQVKRHGIRKAMDRCRPSVPVWIMPIHSVAEQIELSENIFDVVIVDEASQAGLEATFLQFLARKIVVIGDDKQVSPSAVGVDQQQLRDLAKSYIKNDRYFDSWVDPKRSLFDEAVMRYGGQLTLVEHRRSVPEIIGFSNRISYEPNGIKLQPVRQFGADRLRPFVVQHVENGYQDRNVNKNEARTLVDDIKSCLSDPAFDGKTMAVITLLGTDQSKLIESLLLDEVPNEEWTSRDLRVGPPPEFQGSERDVIFLSMVSSPSEDRRLSAMTSDAYVQRFNVAVSRAKDQVRLFHSITLNELSNHEDMRHHLLDYAYGIVRRTEGGDGGQSHLVPEDELVTPFDSLFEQRVYNRISGRGFTVEPQVESLGYFIDLVVKGANGQLAVECDGDHWHGPNEYQKDLARQRELERCGWTFFRIRESEFYFDPTVVMNRLWEVLEEMEIRPSDWTDSSTTRKDSVQLHPSDTDSSQSETESVSTGAHDEHSSNPVAETSLHEENTRSAGMTTDDSLELVFELRDNDSAVLSSPQAHRSAYTPFQGRTVPVLGASDNEILTGLRSIVEVEQPIIGSRLAKVYLEASDSLPNDFDARDRVEQLILLAERQGTLLGSDPLRRPGFSFRTFRVNRDLKTPLRESGPRDLAEVPPVELAYALSISRTLNPDFGHEMQLEAALRLLGKSIITDAARNLLEEVLRHQKSQEERQNTAD